MKKASLTIIVFVSLLLSCSDPAPTKRFCLRLYMVDRRETEYHVFVPIHVNVLQVNSDRGSYYLQYLDERWWNRHWVTIKNGVVDFKYITCNP